MDVVIVHAPSTKAELAGAVPGGAGKIAVIPHGSLFGDQSPLPRDEARRRLGLPEAGRLVLFFGLIESYKGLDYLLHALPAVVDALPDAKLLIAGKPASGFASCRDLLDTPAVGGSTILRLGFVPSAKLAEYYCAADVVAIPYLAASQSGVLLTAYTFGRPVVVTRTGGLGEAVSADSTGLVVDPADSAGLARALVELLADPAQAEDMGRRGRELAAGRYDWRQIAAQTVAAYQAVGG